jgi:hypothetical protein
MHRVLSLGNSPADQQPENYAGIIGKSADAVSDFPQEAQLFKILREAHPIQAAERRQMLSMPSLRIFFDKFPSESRFQK